MGTAATPATRREHRRRRSPLPGHGAGPSGLWLIAPCPIPPEGLHLDIAGHKTPVGALLPRTRHRFPGIRHPFSAGEANLEGLITNRDYATQPTVMARKEPTEYIHRGTPAAKNKVTNDLPFGWVARGTRGSDKNDVYAAVELNWGTDDDDRPGEILIALPTSGAAWLVSVSPSQPTHPTEGTSGAPTVDGDRRSHCVTRISSRPARLVFAPLLLMQTSCRRNQLSFSGTYVPLGMAQIWQNRR